MLSNLPQTYKTSLANKWMSFSSSNSALLWAWKYFLSFYFEIHLLETHTVFLEPLQVLHFWYFSSPFKGVGSNQKMDGKTISRKSMTERYAIFYTIVPMKYEWSTLPTKLTQLLHPWHLMLWNTFDKLKLFSLFFW